MSGKRAAPGDDLVGVLAGIQAALEEANELQKKKLKQDAEHAQQQHDDRTNQTEVIWDAIREHASTVGLDRILDQLERMASASEAANEKIAAVSEGVEEIVAKVNDVADALDSIKSAIYDK